jgi:PAS domain S-box-containing protein
VAPVSVRRVPLVLNVDDREDARYLRTRALREAGFEVREAGSGQEALRLAESERPDLVVLDVRLPDIDGREVCRRLKAAPETRAIPVLQVSAVLIDGQSRAEGLESGADAYLAEPVDPVELVATARALLRSRVAQTDRRQTEELARILFEAGPTLVVAVDGDGRIVLFNRACERLTGYRRDEVVGRPLLDLLIPPARRERVAAFLASARPDILAAPHEHPWQTRAGQERLIEWRCVVTTTAEGERIWLGVGHDVTERHQAGARQFLQFSVTRALADARSIDDAAPALLEATCMILGWDVGEFWGGAPGTGVGLRARWAPSTDLPAPAEELIGQARLTGKPVWIADIQADAAFRAAFAFPVLIEGEVLGVLAFFSRSRRELDSLLLAATADIGEQVGQFIKRTRADAAVRASEARLRLALDAARMGWWEWDIPTGQVSWSPELDALFGLPRGTFPGTYQAFLDMVEPEGRPALVEGVERAFAGLDDYEAEFPMRCADGTTRWASVRGRLLRDEAGRPVRMIGIDRDITAEKRAEEGRTRLAELGRALNETLDLDVLLPKVAEAARQLCRADAGRVGLRDSPIYGCDETGARRYDVPGLGAMPDVGISGRVLATGLPLRTERYADDARFTQPPVARLEALSPDIVSALAVPIPGPQRSEGVLLVFNRTARPFTDQDEAMLLRLADYAAVACRNAEMYRAAETARAEAEAARRGAVTILESITDAFAALDAGWRLRYVNGAAERLVRRRREELLGRVVWEALPETADTRFATECRRALAEQTPVEFEEFSATLGLWLGVRAFPSPEGLSVYVRDVTARRRGDAIFRAEKQVLALLARGAPLGEALELLTGVIEEHSSGMLASILLLDPGGRLDHGAAPSLPAAFSAALDGIPIGPAAGSCGTAAYRGETVIVADIDADPLWADYRELALSHGLRACWSTPIFGSDGGVLGTFALYYREPRAPDPRELSLIEAAAHIARVAIERHRSEEERATLLTRAEAARAEAEAANRTKDRFLATLSHELRNPLGSIASAVAALDRIGGQRPDAARLREIIQRQAQHLGRILEDLLDVTRLTFGKLVLHTETLDLRGVARRCADVFEASGRFAGHSVSVVPEADPVPVEADRARLEQVIDNLLENAAKYSPAGSSIRVEVGRLEREAVLRVRDQGIGLAPDVLERIFEPFTQLGERPADGLGLGLGLVRGIVREHGGTIVARSAGLGQGSEFEVRLPLAAGAVAGLEARAAGRTAPRRVVVVEDSPDAREALVTLLGLLGHQVQAAGDGEEGAALIVATRPDVALVDLALPGVNGYEVARRVRAALGDAVRLVALSGYGGPDDRRRAREAGFDRHVVKPIDPDQLDPLVEGPEPAPDA